MIEKYEAHFPQYKRSINVLATPIQYTKKDHVFKSTSQKIKILCSFYEKGPLDNYESFVPYKEETLVLLHKGVLLNSYEK